MRLAGQNPTRVKILRNSTQLEVIFECLQNGQNWSKINATPEFNDELYDRLKGTKLQWVGGDKKYFQKTLGDVNVNTWQDWVESLDQRFVLLDDNFVTTSLSNIVYRSGIDVHARNSFRKRFESTYGTGSQEDLFEFSINNPYPDLLLTLDPQAFIRSQSLDQLLTRISASEQSKSRKKLVLYFKNFIYGT